MRFVFIIVLFVNLLNAQSALQEIINSVKENAIINLPKGLYKGNLEIKKPVTIIGHPDGSTIYGDGEDTVIKVTGSFVTLKNLIIRNSGDMHQDLDAGITVHDATYVEILDCDIDDCLFGIDMQNVTNSKIIGNKIKSKDFDLGLRGDGLRLWYSNDNLVKKNHLRHSRDMVVWYSHGNMIEENFGEYSRYSLHFMYTGANTVRNNTYEHNSVGIFFMYSRDTVAYGNVIKNSLGATGMGIGLKEASNFTIKDNTVIYCAQGFYIDWSPFEPEMPNLIEGNHILYNAEGMHFHAISIDNDIKNNNFVGNMENVVNDSKKTQISQNRWEGNYWDDYEGFDRDRDGVGDTPYVSFAYADKMWLYNPDVKFFYGSPVIAIIDFLAKLAPFSEPVLQLKDHKPRIQR
ncbi:MAG: nitrous oxide reductase family maturation protein NosD [Epsilonproteobacteria bacterium]|nr:nitrous oxide reductase family maturation protein NosD [Campylobacterota bacterium]